MSKKKFFIDGDLETEFRDEGQWRSYSVYSDGYCLLDLIQNASITENDQDGGEIDTYGIDDAPLEVQVEAVEDIGKEYFKLKIERAAMEASHEAEPTP